MGRKVVIVGGVAGGASCAARLRRLDGSMEIVVLEKGEYISYANCGLPYHVGGVIRSRGSLLLLTPEEMKAKYDVDVRVKSEVISIDRQSKTLKVRRTDSGEVYEESYDTLVLATGSTPLRPPIPGIDSERIQTLWTVPDTERILSFVKDGGCSSAAVIGAGFIGLEMAENLRSAGLEVSVIEMLDQVMAPLDYEMALLLHENIRQSGVRLYLGDGVESFEEKDGGVGITLRSGKTLFADIVVLCIGVRPNGELAKTCGLETNERGGIVTDEYLRTSDKDIYAVGDTIEVEDYIFRNKTMVPLAGPANKQGRIAANNIAGAQEKYEGSLGTSIAKVFDLTAASTGANEKTLIARGLVKGKDYLGIIIVQNSHATYYPGAQPMTLKLLFSVDGSRIFGAQIVGRDGVDKRIDTIAATIRLGGGVSDLKKLELAYAPPYSSPKDPVNMAGFTAENAIRGMINFAEWDAVETHPGAVVLDVREPVELAAFSIPGAVNIPLGQLRDRLGELDKSKEYIVFCAVGVRAYNAERILMLNGFEHVLHYPGGMRFYRSTHSEEAAAPSAAPGPAASSGPLTAAETGEAKSAAGPTVILDCTGLQCPGPLMQIFRCVAELKDGDTVEVTASDPGFTSDIEAWCRRTGNTLLSNERRGTDFVALVKKSSGTAPPVIRDTSEGKTIIVFSGDLDKVLAAFIIANGAASMGRPVTMFFTFWGLTVLRKPAKQRVEKTFMEKMFGAMLPRGIKKLKLSRMNMGGMGTAMMKKIMSDKNVDSLEALVKKAMESSVRIVACAMSMDVMGIKREELIDGVEVGGVGMYLGAAEESGVNLFI